VRARGPFAAREAGRLLTQIAQALDAAHSRGLVHRDVKPANVLVTCADGEEHLYLTDFGLARRVLDSRVLTSSGMFVGTIGYISPEQIQGEHVDARSDVYSLGCVLYHLLVGAAPFESEELGQRIFAHGLGRQATAVSELVKGLPAGLDAVIARAMAGSPGERFLSAGDLARAAVAAATQSPNLVPERSVATGEAAFVVGAPAQSGRREILRWTPAIAGPLAAIWPSSPARRRRRVVQALAAAAAVAIAVLVPPWLSRPPNLTVYSSWPHREQDADGEVIPNARTMDMERAARLALEQAGAKASKFDVAYEPLDSADASDESPAMVVPANARRAAGDDATAAYIGDFTSGATQQSLPILSRARVPQISVSSTRNGLTMKDRRGDEDEPERYYPDGYRNFARIIPTTAVHARALLRLMAQRDRCRRVAIIDDGSPYGNGLVNDIRAFNRDRVEVVYADSVGPRGSYERQVDQARVRAADCFVYSGTNHPNTIPIFVAIARELGPRAKLYGTNGVAQASFFGRVPSRYAGQITIMVPPRDNRRTATFVADFKQRYRTDSDPDPYAVYAYEAMLLALDAIADSATGKREDIRDALFATRRRQSALGSYSITDTGDTSITSYGFSTIKGGTLRPPNTIR